MPDTPRVSVILTTYNRPAYLREAIASVLAQSDGAFELIIIDDGSDEATAAVVAGFDDGRIRYMYQENAGHCAALNRGLALARGEYIVFLDDDDYYLPHNLATQAAFLEANPHIGLVGANVTLIAADGAPLGDRAGWSEARELTWPACLYACPLVPSAVMLRRERLGTLQEWFDRALVPFHDVDFWTRLHLAGCRMQWTPEVISAYRLHAGQMRRDGEGYYRAYLRELDKLYARDDLSPVLVDERPALYAHYHLVGACYAYAAGDVQAGRQRLRLAAEADPCLVQGTPPPFAEKLAGIAQTVTNEGAVAQIDAMFDTLPPELARLRPWRRHALSALHMQQVFAAHAAGNRPRLNDWMQGVYWNPRWLRNRGVWSILLRDVIMGGAAAGPGG